MSIGAFVPNKVAPLKHKLSLWVEIKIWHVEFGNHDIKIKSNASDSALMRWNSKTRCRIWQSWHKTQKRGVGFHNHDIKVKNEVQNFTLMTWKSKTKCRIRQSRHKSWKRGVGFGNQGIKLKYVFSYQRLKSKKFSVKHYIVKQRFTPKLLSYLLSIEVCIVIIFFLLPLHANSN